METAVPEGEPRETHRHFLVRQIPAVVLVQMGGRLVVKKVAQES